MGTTNEKRPKRKNMKALKRKNAERTTHPSPKRTADQSTKSKDNRWQNYKEKKEVWVRNCQREEKREGNGKGDGAFGSQNPAAENGNPPIKFR